MRGSVIVGGGCECGVAGRYKGVRGVVGCTRKFRSGCAERDGLSGTLAPRAVLRTGLSFEIALVGDPVTLSSGRIGSGFECEEVVPAPKMAKAGNEYRVDRM